MTPRVVYDTNVVVSATLKAGSIPASLVTLALDRHVRLCLSPIIFAEYEAVLKRPKFAFDAHTEDAFLRDLRRVAVMIFPANHITTRMRFGLNPKGCGGIAATEHGVRPYLLWLH